MKNNTVKRKNQLKNFCSNLLFWGVIIFFVVLVLGFVALEIYLWVVYGSTPVEELPAWVVFFMFGGRH